MTTLNEQLAAGQRAALVMANKMQFEVEHSEECALSGHDECEADPTEPEGWSCESGDLREECEGRECECSVSEWREASTAVLVALNVPCPHERIGACYPCWQESRKEFYANLHGACACPEVSREKESQDADE